MGKKGKRKAKKKNSNLWHCPNCSNPNPNNLEQCTSCGQLRPITVKSKALTQTLGPRTTASILGRIVPGAVPTKRVLAQLAASLDQERKRHQPVVDSLKTGQPPPHTFETPGMIELNPGGVLLFPGCTPALTFVELPATSVGILADGAFGEEDHQKHFSGGTCTMLSLGSSIFYYLGTCHFITKDLWDFAVMFRPGGGTFVWPKYETCIMCPLCGVMAKPDDTKNKEWIVASQHLMQTGLGPLEGRVGQRLMPRMFCKDCLGCEGIDPTTGVCGIVGGGTVQTYPSAYSLVSLFENSGMCSAVSQNMMKLMSQSGNSTGTNMRLSKSLTKDNRGQGVMLIGNSKQLKTRCNYCKKTKKEIAGEIDDDTGKLKAMNKCSSCLFVAYCSRTCQRSDWKNQYVWLLLLLLLWWFPFWLLLRMAL